MVTRPRDVAARLFFLSMGNDGRSAICGFSRPTVLGLQQTKRLALNKGNAMQCDVYVAAPDY
jgi:hypothetical protein